MRLLCGTNQAHHDQYYYYKISQLPCAATGTVLSTEVKSLHALICLQEEELLQEQKLQIQEKNK